MNSYLVVLIFQLIGSFAIIAEIMVPSMGLLTVSALGSFSFSYYTLYQFNADYIWVLILINLISIPLTLIMGIKFLSITPLATGEGLHVGESKEETSPTIGLIGVSLTDLRPSGIAKIDGKRVDVLSTGDYIDKGVDVEVVEVDNSGVKVCKSL